MKGHDIWGNAFIPTAVDHSHTARQEDRILHQWWRDKGGAGGSVVTEVPLITESEGPRVDAIRLPNRELGALRYRHDTSRVDRRWNADLSRIKKLVSGHLVQVIEVKRDFSRDGIGQLLVARELFADRFGRDAGLIESVLVVQRTPRGPKSLIRVCNRLAIRIEAPAGTPADLVWHES